MPSGAAKLKKDKQTNKQTKQQEKKTHTKKILFHIDSFFKQRSKVFEKS